MPVHVVYVRPMPVGPDGNVVDKNNASIAEMTMVDQEMRVVEDVAHAPNSSGNPSIKDYLVAEDGSGFSLAHMDNTIIVTQS